MNDNMSIYSNINPRLIIHLTVVNRLVVQKVNLSYTQSMIEFEPITLD